MNFQSIKPQNLIAAAALLAPIVVVQGVRLLFGGGGPRQASAMTTGGDQTLAPAAPVPLPTDVPAAPALNAAQKAAVEHLNAERTRITIFTSPFNHLVPKSVAMQTGPVVTPSPQTPSAAPVAIPPEVRALSLGALMRNDTGAFAVISGRVRSVGEVIVPGWKVTDIDPTTLRVTLTADDGTSVTLSHEH